MFTDLREEELIESVSIPTEPFPPERTGMTFLELKRAAQTFLTVSAATSIRVDDPTWTNRSSRTPGSPWRTPQISCSASRTPRPTSKAVPSSDEALEAVVETVASAVTPESEMHADRDYKEEVAGEYAKRSLETSYERAVATEI